MIAMAHLPHISEACLLIATSGARSRLGVRDPGQEIRRVRSQVDKHTPVLPLSSPKTFVMDAALFGQPI